MKMSSDLPDNRQMSIRQMSIANRIGQSAPVWTDRLDRLYTGF